MRSRRSTPSSPRTRPAPEAAEAAYAAVLCYQNIYEETHKGDAGRRARGNLPGARSDEPTSKAKRADASARSSSRRT